jgi:hypothetical protein
MNTIQILEQGQCSQYSNWLRDGPLWGRSSNPCRVKNFHFSMLSRLALGPTQPPIQWVPGALSPGVKQPGREADHSPPTSAKIKKTWVYTSTPQYTFMMQCLDNGTTLPFYCTDTTITKQWQKVMIIKASPPFRTSKQEMHETNIHLQRPCYRFNLNIFKLLSWVGQIQWK